MKKIKVIKEAANIPLDDLVIDIAQVRTDSVGKNITELAESIRTVGLIEPIVVFPAKEKGKYEILAGQRRFLACKEAGLDSIQAKIIERPENEYEAKILSLHENWMREDISKKDEINICLLLFRRYKNVQYIAQETGLPINRIRQNLKYESLIDKLKKLVDDGEVDVNIALRAQEAASQSGTLKEDDAISFAKEMSNMSGAQVKKVIKDKKENPDANTHDIIEKAKSGEKIIQTIIIMSQNTHQALKKYADLEKMNLPDAGANLIEESLLSKGFISE